MAAGPVDAEDGWTALTVATVGVTPGEPPDEPRSRLGQTMARGLEGIAAGLADPRLVLPWLLASLGAPLLLVGLLVPVAGSAALLGQLLATHRLGVLERPKWLWVGGNTLAGTALILMALAVVLLDGRGVGWAILLGFGLFGVGQGVALAARARLGTWRLGQRRSIAISRRAGLVAGGGIGAFALYLAVAGEAATPTFFSLVLTVAGILLVYAAATVARLPDVPRALHQDAAAWLATHAREGGDAAPGRLVAIRLLFLSTALLPPYLAYLLWQGGGIGLADLGSLVLAAAVAGLVADPTWSAAAGTSSRQLLATAGGLAALAAGAMGLLVMAVPNALGLPLVAPAAIFLLVLARAGIRQGLASRFVEQTGGGNAAAFGDALAALALLVGGLAALAAAGAGIGPTLLLLAAAAGLGTWLAQGLPEVERHGKI